METTELLYTLHVKLAELRGILPGAEAPVSTAFWSPLARFVFGRADAYELTCQAEDTDAIKTIMPYAETVERRRAAGILLFWGAVTAALVEDVAGGHGTGREGLWWQRIVLTREGEIVFELKDYGATMTIGSLTQGEADYVADLLPAAARIERVTVHA